MKVVLLTGDENRHKRFSDRIPHLRRFIDRDDINAQTGKVKKLNPDVIFVYGTGKLGLDLVHAAPYVLNFHGGDPERYRGLDSHLWALLGGADELLVTLHHVDEGLDTGDVVFQTQLYLSDVRSLTDLPYQTMETCVQLAQLALHGIQTGFLPRRRQSWAGEYRSRFPDELRGRCEVRLRELTS